MGAGGGLRGANFREKPRARPARFWPWVVLSGLVALGLAVAWEAQAPVQYRASCTVLLRADPAGQPVAGGAAEAVALQARPLMERAVAELSLNARCFRPGWPQPAELYGPAAPVRVRVDVLDAAADEQSVTLYLHGDQAFELADHGPGRSTYRFGQAVHRPYGSFTVLRRGAAGRPPGGKVLVRLCGVARAAEPYSRSLTVAPVNHQAAVLTISLLAPGPGQGNDVVAKLVEVYNREHQQARRAQVANTIRFIDRRLLALGRELAASVAPDTGRAAPAPVPAPAASGRFLRGLLARAAARRAAVAALVRALAAGGTLPQQPVPPGPVLPPLVAHWNALQAERARLLRTTEPENPLVLNLTEQLAALRGQLGAALRLLAAGLTAPQAGSRGVAAPARAPVAVAAAPRAAPRRPQEATQALYRYFLQRKEEAALSLAAAGPAARVLDPARARLEPRALSAPLIYLLALLAGLVAPWGLRRAWPLGEGNGAPSRPDLVAPVANMEVNAVESEVAVPVAGVAAAPVESVMVGPLPPDQLLAVAANGESQPAEAYHRLREHLWTHLAGQPAQVLLVSSGQADEGQTVVALNLAASLGQAGRQVLVLDCNLRTPHLGRYVKRVVTAGVSTYLGAKTLPLAPLLRQHGLGLRVSWLGAGPVPANPAELLAGGRAAELLEELKPRFDHILVLTAPLGTAADALAIAPLADVCLFVARRDSPRAPRLALLEQIFQDRQRRQPVVVVNEGPQ